MEKGLRHIAQTGNARCAIKTSAFPIIIYGGKYYLGNNVPTKRELFFGDHHLQFLACNDFSFIPTVSGKTGKSLLTKTVEISLNLGGSGKWKVKWKFNLSTSCGKLQYI